MKRAKHFVQRSLYGLRCGLFAVLSAAVCLPAYACECAFGPLSQAEVEASKQVFVFQLVAAEHVATGTRPQHEVIATIRVVDSLLGGDAPSEMRYTTFWCCGSNLHMGHYYAAFLPADASASFAAHAGNLLPLGEFLLDEQLRKLLRVVAREARLEACFGESPSTSIEISPPPPPPIGTQTRDRSDWGAC